jgi:M3 family oligoendopeptidase
MAIHFRDIVAPPPKYEEVAAEHQSIHRDFDAASDVEGRLAALRRWDVLRRRLDTWSSLTQLRFNQDTRNEEYKKARDYADALRPKLMELDVAMKRKLVESPHRSELQGRLGPQAFALWESEITTYDPAIEQEMVREAALESEYVELQAAAQLEFRGRKYNLSEIVKFREDPDRQTRYDAERVRWSWFAENAAAMDRIFDDLVRLRTEMARKLGFENYIGLAYKRLCRIDYSQADVEVFRRAVREHVVPLAAELRRRQARDLGLDELMFWDLALYDPKGNPAPQGDHDWMLDRAQEMFDELGGGMGEFFRTMNDGGLLDLKNREGKAGGGFCTGFPAYGLPYIFANFNGTKGTSKSSRTKWGTPSSATRAAISRWPTTSGRRTSRARFTRWGWSSSPGRTWRSSSAPMPSGSAACTWSRRSSSSLRRGDRPLPAPGVRLAGCRRPKSATASGRRWSARTCRGSATATCRTSRAAASGTSSGTST